MPLAGNDLTQYMERLLVEDMPSLNLTSSAEMYQVMFMKGADKQPNDDNADYSGCYVAADFYEEEKVVEAEDFKLPDGTKVAVHSQRIRVPELMFNPSFDGHEMPSIAECINQCQMATPVDCRGQMLSGVLMFGGNMTWKEGPGDNNLQNRLKNEIVALGVDESKVKCSQMPDGNFISYSGAQMLAGLSTYKEVTIKKDEWQDHGSGRIVLERCT